MILTTTSDIPGNLYQVKQIIGLVGAEVVLGINVVKDFTAGIRNIVGGRAGSYEKEMEEAQAEALRELEERATEMGANAVIGVKFDYTSFGANNGMIALVVNGTAVVVE